MPRESSAIVKGRETTGFYAAETEIWYMHAAPHVPAPAKKRGFFCNPIHLDRPVEAKEKRRRYEAFVKLMAENTGPARAARVLFSTVAGKDYGDHQVISSMKMLDEMGRGISSPVKAEALRLVAELEAHVHPASRKKRGP